MVSLSEVELAAQESKIANLLQQGLALHQQGKLEAAEEVYRHILILHPKHFDSLQLLGIIFLQTGNYLQALDFLSKAIQINPSFSSCYYNRGIVLQELHRLDEALSNYDSAISVEADYAEAYFNRGNVLHEMNRLDEALSSYDKAISIQPNFAEFYSNRGNALKKLKRLEEALSSYDQAISIKADYAEVHYNSGIVLQELHRLDEALFSYDKAILIKADFAEAYFNRGDVLKELKRLDEALSSYDQAILIKADYVEVYSNRGLVLQQLHRLDEALSSYDQAISIKADCAEAYSNRGEVLQQLKRFEESLNSLDKAISIKPEIDYILGSYIYTKMYLCDWSDFQPLVNQLSDKIRNNQKTTTPFISLSLIDDPDLHRQASRIFADNECPVNDLIPIVDKYPLRQKIRIGYFSADFREHPVSYLTAELFELHNRDQFEIIGFSFGPDTQDPLRKRLEKGFDQFLDVKDQTDKQIASLAREMKIDIAIDLAGYTGGARTNIFSMRAAPIQVNYLGYPGTMASNFIDYIIADPILIPQDKQHYYSEKVVYLPETYMINDSRLEPSQKTFSREVFGLLEDAFIFACFNGSYKITPTVFAGWVRILKAVNNSLLWLSNMDKIAIKNLKNKAEEFGIDSDRIIVASSMDLLSDHLKRISLADLFLDTFPYNAHTTCNDALRVGLPVLTLMGESFAGRVAASLLNAVQLPELITTSPHAYETLAIELGTNPEKMGIIKSKLARNLLNSPLYNTKLFTQHIELAYQKMYQRYQDNLTPDHIYIEN